MSKCIVTKIEIIVGVSHILLSILWRSVRFYFLLSMICKLRFIASITTYSVRYWETVATHRRCSETIANCCYLAKHVLKLLACVSITNSHFPRSAGKSSTFLAALQMIQTISRRVRRDSVRHLADLWLLLRYRGYFRTILIFPVSSEAINSQSAEVLQKVILSHATLTLSYLTNHVGISQSFSVFVPDDNLKKRAAFTIYRGLTLLSCIWKHFAAAEIFFAGCISWAGRETLIRHSACDSPACGPPVINLLIRSSTLIRPIKTATLVLRRSQFLGAFQPD